MENNTFDLALLSMFLVLLNTHRHHGRNVIHLHRTQNRHISFVISRYRMAARTNGLRESWH